MIHNTYAKTWLCEAFLKLLLLLVSRKYGGDCPIVQTSVHFLPAKEVLRDKVIRSVEQIEAWSKAVVPLPVAAISFGSGCETNPDKTSRVLSLLKQHLN